MNAVVIGQNGYIGQAICKKLIDLKYEIHPWVGNALINDSYSCLPDTLDVAIYLPGMNVISPIHELSEEGWNEVMNVNLYGAFLFARSAFKALKKTSGCFITISSILTQHPYPNRVAYAAAKAGLETLIRGLAIEWGEHGISTHCIRLGHLAGFSPSWPKNQAVLDVVRDKTPQKKLNDRDDVASYIAWLVQGGCKTVNGGVIDMDAGYTINRWIL